MTEFSITVENLLRFLELASLPEKETDTQSKSGELIPDLLVFVDNTGLSAKAKTKSNNVFVDVLYKVGVELKEAGVLPLGSVEELRSYLGRFNSTDKVAVKATESRLTITRTEPVPKKTVRLPLASEKHIESVQGVEMIMKNFTWDNGLPVTKKGKLPTALKVDAGAIYSAIQDGAVVVQKVYPFIYENKTLTIRVGSDKVGEIENELVAEASEPSKAQYSTGMEGIFKTLSGEVNIYFGTDAPLVVKKTSADYEATYVVAPVKEFQ